MAHREQEIQWLNDDIVRAHQWRVADMERFLRREKMQSEHLVCEARAEQLSTVSEQSALLCGFIVSAMCNVGVPDNVHASVLFLYAVSGTSVCVAMLICAVMCTNLLLAVTRYAAHTLEDSVRSMDMTQLEWESPFSSWWLRRCEKEQMTAYKFLLFGVAFFFLYLGAVSWVQFYMSTGTSLSISSLSFVGFLIWQLRIASKWRYLLTPPLSRNAAHGMASSAQLSALSDSYLSMPKTPRTMRKSAMVESSSEVPGSTFGFT
uniref:Calcium release-activated calcium channel protein 1 n=1 Tax=Hyaloperonospora arabidopsidis (strain Emoy2) TaxID=559515 RepID=M4B9F9_HYAAE